MNGKVMYSACMLFGVLSLALLIANVALINSNRQLQDSANQRQADINKGNTLTTLNQGIIQALAEAATSKNDVEAKNLLAAQGITVTPSVPATAAPAPVAPAAAPAKSTKK